MAILGAVPYAMLLQCYASIFLYYLGFEIFVTG
jgi:hypothetical protein